MNLSCRIFSAILLYQVAKNYVEKRSSRQSWPVIALTQTGGLVAVIPTRQPSFDSASRFSVDSLIRVPGEPDSRMV